MRDSLRAKLFGNDASTLNTIILAAIILALVSVFGTFVELFASR